MITRKAAGANLRIIIFRSVKNDCCQVCENKFRQPDEVKKHLLDHAGHLGNECETCREVFKKYDPLKLHMKTIH